MEPEFKELLNKIIYTFKLKENNLADINKEKKI